MQAATAHQIHSYGTPLNIQIQDLQSLIRKNPGRCEYRIHIAQLLMVTGEWQKALQQLQTAAQLDKKAVAMAQTYRALIQAEIQREHVFQGKVEPQFFTTPDDWQILLAEALIARSHQQIDASEKFQQQAYADAPALTFSINENEVEWLADGDSRLGPVCEVFINGNYYWLPFNQIQQMNIDHPQDLRDLVWIPATITLTDFSRHFGFLPSRYVGSYQHDNDQLSLANLTQWQALSEHCWSGVGQKMLITDQIEYPLLSVRTITQAVSQ
ncbi:type VI secretion system accessory protein TagJ [Cellvibrio sp. pealriver]|uniref:type VI secretion system accessory protein TagJ n=1 Tax=Cellvibrio sp. pealriver TaxID=1622269 RepID=UPI00066FD287|nr:type VI secretion system accessory protein TagJ [Cellvibrio sp. pealriver]